MLGKGRGRLEAALPVLDDVGQGGGDGADCRQRLGLAARGQLADDDRAAPGAEAGMCEETAAVMVDDAGKPGVRVEAEDLVVLDAAPERARDSPSGVVPVQLDQVVEQYPLARVVRQDVVAHAAVAAPADALDEQVATPGVPGADAPGREVVFRHPEAVVAVDGDPTRQEHS